MRIAINCRSILLPKRTGIGRYAYHLIDSLGAIDHANTYILHAPKRPFDLKRRLPDFSRYKNFKSHTDLLKRGASASDIYHLPSPDAIGKYTGKLVVTVHDMVHKAYPQSQESSATQMTEKYMQAIGSKADKIICISENTRRDLHAFMDIPFEKTCVVHNGVDHALFYPLPEVERRQAVCTLEKFGIRKPYILSVGTIEPRKNLNGLLESFVLLKSKKAFDGLLVVAGMKGWMVENINGFVKQLGLGADVIFTGYVSDAELRQLYGMAEVFVFPSLYEGFGFPILEAFCCGVPVVTSQTSSCGEIAGKAALTIDPRDTQAMMQAVVRILTDPASRESLREAGFRRAGEFSFEKTARQTLAVYQELAIS